jgi:tetratricopeptide (TPR) repeat protein
VEQTRADALYALDRADEAMRSAERALDAYVARRDAAGTAAVCYTISRIAGWQGTAPRMLAPIQRAVATLPRDDEHAWCLGSAACANVLTGAGRVVEAAAMLRDVIAVSERIGANEALGAALMQLALIVGRNDESLALTGRAVPLLEHSYQPVTGMAASVRLVGLAAGGHLDELEGFLPRAEAMAVRAGHSAAVGTARFMRLLLHVVRTGDVRSMRDQLAAALRQPQQALMRRWLLVNASGAEFQLGDLARAAALLEEAITIPVALWEPREQMGLCALHAWSGDHDRARDKWKQIQPIVSAARLGAAGWETSVAAAWTLELIGETVACAALLPALEELVGHESLMLYDTLGPTLTQTAAGIAAQAAGHAERARDHFEHALATAGRLRSPLLGPPAKLWYGRHLCAPDRDADSRAKGAALLAEALEEFRGLGMPIHMQYAERWLSEPSAA